MRTLTARALRTLVVSAALAFAAPAVAIETLVNTAERAMPSVSVAPTEKAHTAILNDVSAFPHYTGAVNASAAIRNRGFSLTLPDTGETVTIENLEVAEIEGGYTLTTPAGAEGPVLDMVVMGTTVRATLLIGDEDLYIVTPLGDGAGVVHRQDRNEGMPPSYDTHLPEIVDPQPLTLRSSAPGAQAPAVEKNVPAPRNTATAPIIDILFAYNALARERGGDMPTRIALTVLHMNRFFANSEMVARVRSAGLHEVDYAVRSVHAEYPDALKRIIDPDDGYMDEVHAKRAQTGADVVALLLGNPSNELCFGGVAHVLRYDNIEHPAVRRLLAGRAFLVADFGAPARCIRLSAKTITHELGHLAEGLHNPERYENLEALRARFSAYGFGRCNVEKNWHTIMSTNRGSGNARCLGLTDSFSNPDVLFEGDPTGTAHLHDVARLIDENAPHVAAFLDPPEPPPVHTRHLPFLPQANAGALLGFVRLHNRTEEDAEIEIYGFDETGERFGPITTTLLPGRARGLNAHHLEGLADHAALEEVLGDGEGHWRLMLRSATPFEARAYVRTPAGFGSPMHLRAALIADSAPRAYHVPFLNPGSNLGSRGYLRITNPSWEENTVTLRAWDDSAEPAENAVTLTIAPRATVTLSAQDLEKGNPDRFEGRFGDGAGKWRVRAESADQRALFVLGLVATRDGALHNVSR